MMLSESSTTTQSPTTRASIRSPVTIRLFRASLPLLLIHSSWRLVSPTEQRQLTTLPKREPIVLSCLLALKSALLICVSSPIVLRDPIAAYLLQSIGSRSVDVLLLQTIYWTVSALLSPEEEAEAEEAQEDSSQAISSREDIRLTKPHSRSQEGPWADLDFSAGNRHRQSSDGDLESWPSQWDTRIIVKDPSQEHSLDALRAMTTPALRVHGQQTRGSQVQMSCESPPKPLKALRYRHAERGPKEILDDLVTV
jgi:hypothetical protein